MKKKLLLLMCLPLAYACNQTTNIGDLDVAFYATYEYSELFQALESANTFLRENSDAVDNKEKENNEVAKEEVEEIENTVDQKPLLSDIEDQLASDSADAVLSFEHFAKENPLYAVLYPNIDQHGQLNLGPVVGFCAVKDTTQLNIYLSDNAVMKFFPSDVKFSYTVKPFDSDGKFVQLVALKLNTKNHQPQDSCRILKAQTVFDNSMPEISLELDSTGALQFKKLSSKNIGRSIAIVINGSVYAFPTVQQEIDRGMINITGDFILTEVKDLVLRINGRKAYFF